MHELIGAPFLGQNACVLSPTGHFRNFWDFLGALGCNDFSRDLGFCGVEKSHRGRGVKPVKVVREGEEIRGIFQMTRNLAILHL